MSDLNLTERLRAADRLPAPDLWPDVLSREPRANLPESRASSRLVAALVAVAVATAGIVLAVRTLGGVPGSPSAYRGNGEIAFVRSTRGPSILPTHLIYVVRPDGGDLRKLTSGLQPAWAPNGKLLAFAGGGHRGISVIGVNGKGLRQVTNCPQTSCDFDEQPTWSPDGSRLAFIRAANTNQTHATAPATFDLYTVNSDGSGLTRWTHCGSAWTCRSADHPSWSPDGRRIVFDAARNSRTGIELLIVLDLETGRLRTIHTCSPCEGPTPPAWSPDGRTIAFTQTGSLYLIAPDGSGLRQLDACDHSRGCQDVEDPAWSPDGRFITFEQVSGPGLGRVVIALIGADGQGLRELTDPRPGFGDIQPAWQPIPTRATSLRSPTPSSPDSVELLLTLPPRRAPNKRVGTCERTRVLRRAR